MSDSTPTSVSVSGRTLSAKSVRFGMFEVNFVQRELRKRGLRIRLQEQPFKILEMLLAARGRLVTRKELAESLWPSLHVSFDQSLNTAMSALRLALGDSSKSCRYIETRPGLGYCFLAPVEEIAAPAVDVSTAASSHPPAVESAALEEYCKGRYFSERGTSVALWQSIAYFQTAVDLDAAHAAAYAGHADAYASLAILNALSPNEAHAKADGVLTLALERNANSVESQVAAGLHLRVFHRDWDGAASALHRALEIAPRHSAAHRESALLSAARGWFPAACDSIRKALAYDPVSLATNCAMSWILYLAGRFEEAQEHCWKTLSLDSALPFAQYVLGLAQEQLGLMDEAIAELQNARTCWNDNPAALAGLAHAYAKADMRNEAQRVTEELRQSASACYVSPYWLAIAYTGFGDKRRAAAALEQGRREDDVWAAWSRFDPRLAE
ncbi:MAG TPA: winged helix-turn-helix domain-containing protein [Bryobacteraceae bacterium]|nr:winged helix-turn-helix domain-containing protein [Bryobacteraceae bacterium]